MLGFYGDMRIGILNLSVQKRSFVLDGTDIRNLPEYTRAKEEYQNDFDDTVLGSLSKGSMNKGQVKVKELKSPFASLSNFNGKSDTDSSTMPKTESNQEITNQRYYEPEAKDEIDALIA